MQNPDTPVPVESTPNVDQGRIVVRVIVGVLFAVIELWDLALGALTGNLIFLAAGLIGILAGAAYALGKEWGRIATAALLLLGAPGAFVMGRFGLLAIMVLLFVGFLYANPTFNRSKR